MFEITVTISDSDLPGNDSERANNGISWIGFGSGTPAGTFNEAAGAGFRIEAGNVSSGRLGLNAPTFLALSDSTNHPGSGTHRSRISSDGTTLTFDYDADFGGTFASNFTHSILLLSLTGFDSTNSYLFFGGTANAAFDDMTITATDAVSSAPEPTTAALLALGLLGAGFARKRHPHQ